MVRSPKWSVDVFSCQNFVSIFYLCHLFCMLHQFFQRFGLPNVWRRIKIISSPLCSFPHHLVTPPFLVSKYPLQHFVFKLRPCRPLNEKPISRIKFYSLKTDTLWPLTTPAFNIICMLRVGN
jgi:hypothetical protein